MGWKKKSLEDVSVAGKRVLMRADLNVPIEAGKVADDLRIRATLPAVKTIIDGGGSVVLMSHLGRPKKREPEFSMAPVAERLAELAGRPVKMAGGCVEPEVLEQARALEPGGILLLENLRYYPGEKKADQEFASKLAALGDMFVGDAFGTAHRGDASVAVVPKILKPAVAGPLIGAEIRAFARVLDHPQKPFVAALGGAKVSDKIPVIMNLLDKVDRILIGGGMAYTFLKAKGVPIGNSKLEEDLVGETKEILAKAGDMKVDILLPADHRAGDSFGENAELKVFTGGIEDGWMGLDIGPASEKAFAEAVAPAGTVIWNGPMGVFEFEKFSSGSRSLARAIADSKAFSVVGGGDTAAAVGAFDLAGAMGHVSTGGGASLALLAGNPMPGIEALDDV